MQQCKSAAASCQARLPNERDMLFPLFHDWGQNSDLKNFSVFSISFMSFETYIYEALPLPQK